MNAMIIKMAPARLSIDIHEFDRLLNKRYARKGFPASIDRERKPKHTTTGASTWNEMNCTSAGHFWLRIVKNAPSRYKAEPVPPNVRFTTAGHPQDRWRNGGTISKYAIPLPSSIQYKNLVNKMLIYEEDIFKGILMAWFRTEEKKSSQLRASEKIRCTEVHRTFYQKEFESAFKRFASRL